jgi:uncharacterized DUF497 family protein
MHICTYSAATVLTDDFALTIPDRDADEERFVTLGIDALGRVLVVIYTWRADQARLISARRATRSERQQYEDRQQ